MIDFRASLIEDQGGQVWLNSGDGGFHQPSAPKIALCPEASKVTSSKPSYVGNIERAYKFNDRVSSYTQNFFVLYQTYEHPDADLDNKIKEHSRTPLILDGTFILINADPTSLPATDLYLGRRANDESTTSMAAINIPRHGNRPNAVSRDWSAEKPLPGAINVSYYDGHVALVKLDQLWFQRWYPEYIEPDKRPGLK